MTPKHFYGFWPELGYIEVGERVENTYDTGNSLEHRFSKALGIEYGCPPRHWKWR